MPCSICDQDAPNCDCTADEKRLRSELDDMEEECERLRSRVAALQKCEAWLQKQVAELEEKLSREWQWTDEHLPWPNCRILICTHGSVEEAIYKDGKFIHAQYGERKPKAWRAMPGAPWWRRGQYMP